MFVFYWIAPCSSVILSEDARKDVRTNHFHLSVVGKQLKSTYEKDEMAATLAALRTVRARNNTEP